MRQSVFRMDLWKGGQDSQPHLHPVHHSDSDDASGAWSSSASNDLNYLLQSTSSAGHTQHSRFSYSPTGGTFLTLLVLLCNKSSNMHLIQCQWLVKHLVSERICVLTGLIIGLVLPEGGDGGLLCFICWTCSKEAHETRVRVYTTFSFP